MSKEIGQMLRAVRLEKGLTQVQLSDKIDLTQATISVIETGRGTTTESLVKWAEACDARIEITRDPDPVRRELIEAYNKLPVEMQMRLVRFARALGGLHAQMAEGIIAGAEMIAATNKP